MVDLTPLQEDTLRAWTVRLTRKMRRNASVPTKAHLGHRARCLNYLRGSEIHAGKLNMYFTFEEGLGDSAQPFINTGVFYHARKGMKLYHYPFMKKVAEDWGYDLQ